MENEKKYKVKVGDPFGGYGTAGENLTIKEAIKLEKSRQADLDYFTSTYIEDEKGHLYTPTDEDRIGTMTLDEKTFVIAEVCNEAYRAFSEINYGKTHSDWRNTTLEEREDALATVKYLLENPTATPDNLLKFDKEKNTLYFKIVEALR